MLLNGFKRWRCARKLGLGTAPYVSLGEDEAMGIVALLRASNDRALSLLEQAGFVDELKRLDQMSVAQIAEALSCSKGWVGMRLGLLAEMTPTVRRRLFAGAFPVYAYMYTVRSFMRMNKVKAMLKDIEIAQKSVRRVSAKSHDPRLSSPAFQAQAQWLLAGLLSRVPVFLQSVRQLHDRCGQA